MVSLRNLLSFALSGGAQAQKKPLNIAFTIHSSPSNTFWQAVKKGFDDACQKIGANCQMIFTQTEGSIEQQSANMQAALAASPDALITWGPEGGVGHPDHRLVGDIVAQLVRAGAPGAPERVFYMYIPPEGLRAINPQRGEPPLMIPQTKYLTVHVPFAPADLEAAQRAMGCHRSQFTPEVLQRMLPLQARSWNGSVTLAPWIPGVGGTDLFR